MRDPGSFAGPGRATLEGMGVQPMSEGNVMPNGGLEAIERHAADLAAATGARLMERFRQALTVEYKDHKNEHPVTDADRDAEIFLRDSILDRFPDHGVLGEEGTEPPADAAYVWVIDPLDGTTNFINGLPLWCVSIGVLWHGRPVAGAIYTATGPAAGAAVLRARRGGGAFLNDQPLLVVDEEEPTRKRLATLPAHYWREMRFRKRGPNRLGETRTLGSTTLELALVAAGPLQYALFWGPKIWDVAAGVLIVQEAGGVALTRAGREGPWFDLGAFEPGKDIGATQPSLRGWRGSILAGSPGPARAIAADIRTPFGVPDSIKSVAQQIRPKA